MKLTTLLRLFLVGACMLAGKVVVHAAAEPIAAAVAGGGAVGGPVADGDGHNDAGVVDNAGGDAETDDEEELGDDAAHGDGDHPAFEAAGPVGPEIDATRGKLADNAANPASKKRAAATRHQREASAAAAGDAAAATRRAAAARAAAAGKEGDGTQPPLPLLSAAEKDAIAGIDRALTSVAEVIKKDATLADSVTKVARKVAASIANAKAQGITLSPLDVKRIEAFILSQNERHEINYLFQNWKVLSEDLQRLLPQKTGKDDEAELNDALKEGKKGKDSGSSLTPDERNARILLHPFSLAGMSGVTAGVACALWLTGEKATWTQSNKDAQAAGKPTVTFGEYLKSRINTWPSGKIFTAVALAATVGFGGYGLYEYNK